MNHERFRICHPRLSQVGLMYTATKNATLVFRWCDIPATALRNTYSFRQDKALSFYVLGFLGFTGSTTFTPLP